MAAAVAAAAWALAPRGSGASAATPEGATPHPAVPTPSRPPSAAVGLALYRARCAECHGLQGRGDGVRSGELPSQAFPFGDPAAARSLVPERAYDVITHGRIERLMPPWAHEIAEQERWDVLYGAWSLYLTPDRLVRAAEAWRSCAGCHGGDRTGAESDAPGAAGGDHPWPDSALLDASQDDLLARTREVREAHAGLAGLPDDDVRRALDHARALTFAPLPTDGLQPGGAVSGRVIAGTSGAAAPVDADVQVIPFVDVSASVTGRRTDGPGADSVEPGAEVPADALPGEVVRAAVDASGDFTATGLVVGDRISYRVAVRYDGADYVADDDLVLTPSEPRRDGVEVTVYESSPDVPIALDAVHVVVESRPDEGVARVSEIWSVTNASDRTLAPVAASPSMRLTLPPATLDVSLDGARWRAGARLENGAVVVSAPVPPGTHSLVLTYDLAYLGRRLNFERVLDGATASVRVIAVDPGARLTAAPLGPGRSTAMSDRLVVQAAGGPLGAGSVLAVTVDGLPPALPGAAPPEAVVPRPPSAIGPGALRLGAVALVLVAVALSLSGAGLVPAGRPARSRSARAAYEEVVRRIADLDRARDEGRIATSAHAVRRAALLERALVLRSRMEEVEA